jgi:hypothetical protein
MNSGINFHNLLSNQMFYSRITLLALIWANYIWTNCLPYNLDRHFFHPLHHGYHQGALWVKACEQILPGDVSRTWHWRVLWRAAWRRVTSRVVTVTWQERCLHEIRRRNEEIRGKYQGGNFDLNCLETPGNRNNGNCKHDFPLWFKTWPFLAFPMPNSYSTGGLSLGLGMAARRDFRLLVD